MTSRAHSAALSVLARVGLAARGVVYLVLGWLAVQIARGHRDHQANSRGALAEIAQKPYGVVLLVILAIGLAAYAVWRLIEAAVGTTSDGSKAGPRVASLFGGLIYLGFCVATFSFIANRSQQSGAKQQVELTARVMRHTGGQLLVGAIGLIVVVAGIWTAVGGLRRTFEKDLDLGAAATATRRIVTGLGLVGTVARGVVFAIAGYLTVDAAITFDAKKSTGLDGALHDLARRDFGPWILAIIALGFIAFGLYGLAESRWTRA